MIALLVACGALYLVLGDLHEALLLFASVFFVAGITLYQERKTEGALEALRDLSSPRALVVRDGLEKRVAGRDVVAGDLLVLHEGDRVPADATVLQASDLAADESLLTGESVPVRKSVWDGARPVARPGGDDGPFVYAGTLVVRGRARALVHATGARTEMGRIGKSLAGLDPEETALHRETTRLVRILGGFGGLMCALIVLVYGLSRGDWLRGLLAGLTLAISMVPEEIPVVLTVFLALGAWRMSRKNVLTRKVHAIEALGATTVLCVDKTGTLTQNRMAVQTLAAGGRRWESGAPHPPPSACREALETAVLASHADAFDPMERAFLELGLGAPEGWRPVKEYPLARGRMARVWLGPGGERVVAAKGAPEAVSALCRLERRAHEKIHEDVQRMAQDGLRVLGMARAAVPEGELPAELGAFAFSFSGLAGLADPLRPSARAAIEECRAAGIRVVMITGDHRETARSIARRAGLPEDGDCLTGPELEKLDEKTLRERLATVSVCARVLPEQKLRLVEAFKARGELVAMTGDGVNDAPALKAAHIGVAMGGRGTDVAREAASLVLLDDDFASIVAAARLGRRIFDNLRKAMSYILALHVPIAGLALFPVVLGWPLVLMPVHIVFLEMIIDPACSLVFEADPEEEDVMRRPPRAPAERLILPRLWALSLLQGAGALAILLGVLWTARRLGAGEAGARTMTYAAMILSNLLLILTNLSWSSPAWVSARAPNKALRWVLGGALSFLALAIYEPFLQRLFGFSSLGWKGLAACAASAALTLGWLEGLRLIFAAPRRVNAGRL